MFNFSNSGAAPTSDSNSGITDPSLAHIPDILKKYYAPYQQMWGDTSGVMDKLGSGYKQSPGYQFNLDQTLQAGGQAAAAGGMAGSPMQQQQAQQTASGFASQDYNKYVEDAMKMYMGGVQGYGELGQNLSNVYLSQSQLTQMQQQEEERREEQEEASESEMWGAAIGAAGKIGSAAIMA